jgi:hypothetical protein
MSDIVERIRQMVRDRLSGYHDPGICAELTGAADEIERLREALRLTRDVLKEECGFITGELASPLSTTPPTADRDD